MCWRESDPCDQLSIGRFIVQSYEGGIDTQSQNDRIVFAVGSLRLRESLLCIL